MQAIMESLILLLSFNILCFLIFGFIGFKFVVAKIKKIEELVGKLPIPYGVPVIRNSDQDGDESVTYLTDEFEEMAANSLKKVINPLAQGEEQEEEF